MCMREAKRSPQRAQIAPARIAGLLIQLDAQLRGPLEDVEELAERQDTAARRSR